MDLNELLNKTKNKVPKVVVIQERPYDDCIAKYTGTSSNKGSKSNSDHATLDHDKENHDLLKDDTRSKQDNFYSEDTNKYYATENHDLKNHDPEVQYKSIIVSPDTRSLKSSQKLIHKDTATFNHDLIYHDTKEHNDQLSQNTNTAQNNQLKATQNSIKVTKKNNIDQKDCATKYHDPKEHDLTATINNTSLKDSKKLPNHATDYHDIINHGKKDHDSKDHIISTAQVTEFKHDHQPNQNSDTNYHDTKNHDLKDHDSKKHLNHLNHNHFTEKKDQDHDTNKHDLKNHVLEDHDSKNHVLIITTEQKKNLFELIEGWKQIHGHKLTASQREVQCYLLKQQFERNCEWFHLSYETIAKVNNLSLAGIRKIIAVLKNEKFIELKHDFITNKDGSISSKKGLFYKALFSSEEN